MKVAFITNSRAPYRSLQINKFCEIKNTDFDVYYTNKNINGCEWNVDKNIKFSEYSLFGMVQFIKVISLIRSYDIIILGGYDKKEYIIISILCKLFRKKYILLFDGINPKKIVFREDVLKFIIKKFIIMNAFSIFGNGRVSEEYFSKKFNYPKEKIFNQYLTVDIEKIMDISKIKHKVREKLFNRYKIEKGKRIIVYSGRLVKRKNVDLLIKAISKLKAPQNYILLIVGDGDEKKSLLQLAKSLNVNIVTTGYIKDQKELFGFYYLSDLLVLPSFNEPWGLVINEAMAAALPVIVSDECGASLNLVVDGFNGFIVKAGDEEKLTEAIQNVFNNREMMSKNSLKLIKNWTFNNSKNSMEIILRQI